MDASLKQNAEQNKPDTYENALSDYVHIKEQKQTKLISGGQKPRQW